MLPASYHRELSCRSGLVSYFRIWTIHTNRLAPTPTMHSAVLHILLPSSCIMQPLHVLLPSRCILQSSTFFYYLIALQTLHIPLQSDCILRSLFYHLIAFCSPAPSYCILQSFHILLPSYCILQSHQILLPSYCILQSHQILLQYHLIAFIRWITRNELL